METPRLTLTVRDGILHVRLPSGELVPRREWRRLRAEHQHCCPDCPVRRRLEPTEAKNTARHVTPSGDHLRT